MNTIAQNKRTHAEADQSAREKMTQTRFDHRADSPAEDVQQPIKVAAAHIQFRVQGTGQLQIGSIATPARSSDAWVRPSQKLPLIAKPGPGYRFSHWLVNGEVAGTEPVQTQSAEMDMEICAVFVEDWERHDFLLRN